MAKNTKVSNTETKKKFPFNVFSKKGLAALALAGVMVASPLMLAGCSNGQDGKNGADGTTWEYGSSYTEFTDAKVGDFYLENDGDIWQFTADGWSFCYNNKGPQGETGPTGPQGPAGQSGANWLTGTAITGTGTEISATITNSKVGDLYFNTDTCDIYQCTAENTWNWISNIEGKAGDSAPVITSITNTYEKDLDTGIEYYVWTFNFSVGEPQVVRVEIPKVISNIEIIADEYYSKKSDNVPVLKLQVNYLNGQYDLFDITEDMYVVDETHSIPDFTIADTYNVKVCYNKNYYAEKTITVRNYIGADEILEQEMYQLSATLAAADGSVDAGSTRTTRVVIGEYYRIDEIESISTTSDYCLCILAYDEDFNYIGNGNNKLRNWQDAGTTFSVDSIFEWNDGEDYSKAVYFRIALKHKDETIMTISDITNSDIKIMFPSGQYSYEGEAIDISGKVTTKTLNYEEITTLSTTQDGAVWDNYIFMFSGSGNCSVYTKDTKNLVSSFTLDKNNILSPHSNSVCFGTEYYEDGDEFPLLYSNIYNNENGSLPGVCNVYRIQREDTTFTSTLVQVIKIGFTEDTEYWPNLSNVRPYGNFLVDTDNNKLYCYVMNDTTNKTTYFEFELPALSDGTFDDTYGVNVVTLESTDIISQFNTEYSYYLQGGCYYNGKIYSLEGFTNDTTNKPTLRVIDLENKRQVTVIDLYSIGLTVEPEMIFVDENTLYYATNNGSLYKFTFV